MGSHPLKIYFWYNFEIFTLFLNLPFRKRHSKYCEILILFLDCKLFPLRKIQRGKIQGKHPRVSIYGMNESILPVFSLKFYWEFPSGEQGVPSHTTYRNPEVFSLYFPFLASLCIPWGKQKDLPD